MKKHNTLMTLVAGTLLLGGAVSCSDKLSIPQNGSITQEAFYQTDADAESAIVAVYDRWRGNYPDRLPLLSLLSDEVTKGGTNKQWFSDWKNVNSFDFASNNNLVTAYYQDAYLLIYYCNLVIDNVADDTPVKKRCIAEAKFFRAYAHFHLAALWGENVPVVDHLLSADEYHVSNSADGELWALVEKDLKEAAAVLPSKSGVNDQTQIRVTAEAAKVYLGKAYLWQGKNSDAAKVLDEVIDSHLYKLWDGDYDLLGHVVANNCCEKVLEAQVPNDPANYKKNNINSSNGWLQNIGFNTQKMKLEGNWNSVLASGEGYFAPRKELYEAFVAEEGVDGYRLNSTLKTAGQLKDMGIVSNSELPDHDIYFNWKNRILKADLMPGAGGRGTDNMCINYCDIRYAEVLLLAAEANLGINQAKADAYLNEVRTRAQLPSKTGITLSDIKVEKRLELCYEGVRYMDIIRWGDAYELLKDQGKVNYQFNVGSDKNNPVYSSSVQDENPNAGFKQGKNERLPIPMAEMDVNGEDKPNGHVKQNPGW